MVGAWPWNFLLLAGIALLIGWVYQREGAARRSRIILASLRATALLMVLALLNRPIATLVQTRVEPSVLPVLIDTSLSMKVPDVIVQGKNVSRLAAAEKLFAPSSPLLQALGNEHQLRFYHFDDDAMPVSDARQIQNLAPTGTSTQITQAIRTVLNDLRGQRVAGIVLLTDRPANSATGDRETDLPAIKDSGGENLSRSRRHRGAGEECANRKPCDAGHRISRRFRRCPRHRPR